MLAARGSNVFSLLYTFLFGNEVDLLIQSWGILYSSKLCLRNYLSPEKTSHASHYFMIMHSAAKRWHSSPRDACCQHNLHVEHKIPPLMHLAISEQETISLIKDNLKALSDTKFCRFLI